MAEIQEKAGKGGKGKPKKMSTHIDMTPMVDLAFLLLTFFMLATTFSKPKAMEIIMPDKPKPDDKPPEINQDKVLSLLMGPNNQLYYYIGNFQDPQLEKTDYSPAGVRKLLINKSKQVGDGFMVLIKPSDKASYGNVVNLFDEMNVTAMERYALVEMSDLEKQKLESKLSGNSQ